MVLHCGRVNIGSAALCSVDDSSSIPFRSRSDMWVRWPMIPQVGLSHPSSHSGACSDERDPDTVRGDCSWNGQRPLSLRMSGRLRAGGRCLREHTGPYAPAPVGTAVPSDTEYRTVRPHPRAGLRAVTPRRRLRENGTSGALGTCSHSRKAPESLRLGRVDGTSAWLSTHLRLAPHKIHERRGAARERGEGDDDKSHAAHEQEAG